MIATDTPSSRCWLTVSQAINSMYLWYSEAAKCYVYLEDVISEADIGSCGWIARGWTLQELLASKDVTFYGNRWQRLGTKQELASTLTAATRIPETVLRGDDFSRYSVAQRMSWAAGRRTMRPEDRAYSLLGIFDVNMPMLYGEGKKAFRRLQEEIIKQADDHSIFAWQMCSDGEPGLLADSPDSFWDCSGVKSLSSRKGRSSYAVTNRGLSIKLAAVMFKVDTYLVRLECVDEHLNEGSPDVAHEDFRLGIFLRRLGEDDQYARVMYNNKTFAQQRAAAWNDDTWGRFRTGQPVEDVHFHVRQSFAPDASPWDRFHRVSGFRIASSELLEQQHGKDRHQVTAKGWDPQERIMSLPDGEFGTGTIGELDIKAQGMKIRLIKLGFDFDFNPVCFVAWSGAEHDHRTDTLNRHGALNKHTAREDAEWTPEERAQLPGYWQRTPIDNLAWNEIRMREAKPLPQHPGLWALKGDRIDGLNVSLGGLGNISIQRVKYCGMLLWDVHVENINKSSNFLRRIF